MERFPYLSLSSPVVIPFNGRMFAEAFTIIVNMKATILETRNILLFELIDQL
jgi:hypothetical protein